jgi:TRAP-type C4-dicarboxylate transport system substrate-binding protein
MAPDAFDELSAEDKASFIEAAKIGGLASRTFAAEAEAAGVTALRDSGLTVQTQIDRSRFASAMAAVMPELEQRYGHALIERIGKAG